MPSESRLEGLARLLYDLAYCKDSDGAIVPWRDLDEIVGEGQRDGFRADARAVLAQLVKDAEADVQRSGTIVDGKFLDFPAAAPTARYLRATYLEPPHAES